MINHVKKMRASSPARENRRPTQTREDLAVVIANTAGELMFVGDDKFLELRGLDADVLWELACESVDEEFAPVTGRLRRVSLSASGRQAVRQALHESLLGGIEIGLDLGARFDPRRRTAPQVPRSSVAARRRPVHGGRCS